MLTTRSAVSVCSALILVLGTGMVSGQAYPNKPVRFLTSEPGGATDFFARFVAQGLTASLGQQVIVENRATSAYFAGEIVAKSPADGYSLLFESSVFWIGTLLRKAPFDPLRDFLPITIVAQSPQVLVLNSSVAATSVKELIALAKARPGELNYGSTGVGSGNHFAGELFNHLAGVKIVHVAFKGTGALINDLLSGQVQMRIGSGGSVMPHVKTGKLRALAVTTPQPTALFPGLPTVAATLPGFESGTTLALLAPARTPSPIVNRLNQEVLRFLNQADVKEKFFTQGTGIVGNTPAQAVAALKADMDQTARVIKVANIHPE